MYFRESAHIRDRRFEIILRVNKPNGTVLVGGHPACLDEIIRVNLVKAVKEGRPVLSGVVREGRWVDAWPESNDDGYESEKASCLVYSGRVEASVSDEEAEGVLDELAVNLGTYLKSPKIQVALAEKFWVKTARNDDESTVAA